MWTAQLAEVCPGTVLPLPSAGSEQFLRYILEHIWRDAVSRTILQLAVGQPTLDWLMAFGAEAAESEDCPATAGPLVLQHSNMSRLGPPR
jgi:hypothetical protein